MATNPNSKKAHCPKPLGLAGEALAEWPRITDDLHRAGRLEKTDRVLIIAYVNLWAVYKNLNDMVQAEGGVILMNNGLPGSTAQWRELLKATKELRIILAEMGLTPQSRGLLAQAEKVVDKAELEF